MVEVGVNIVYMEHYNGGGDNEPMCYEHDGDSGFDLRAAIEEIMVIKPGDRVLIPTGIKLSIPKGTEIQVRPRSGTTLKKGLTVGNAPGTIDSGYRGEIKVIAVNNTTHNILISPGERMAQAVLCPVYRATFNVVESLDETSRQEGGFNSTGVN